MSYKIKAKKYHTAVSNYDETTIEEMVRKDYIQHNPKVPTGRDAFVSMIPKLKTYGSKIENIRMLEDGAYVIMHHKWINAIPFGFDETAAFHIIRFDDKGLIAEHWNVMTELVSENEAGRTLLNGDTQIVDLDKTEINKQKTELLFATFIKNNLEEMMKIIPEFFHEKFHQHNPKMTDGIQNLIEVIGKGRFPQYEKQHVVFGEGNFVLSISEGIYLKKHTVFYDLFQFKDEKIMAHWNILQEIPSEELANNNTMFNF